MMLPMSEHYNTDLDVTVLLACASYSHLNAFIGVQDRRLLHPTNMTSSSSSTTVLPTSRNYQDPYQLAKNNPPKLSKLINCHWNQHSNES